MNAKTGASSLLHSVANHLNFHGVPSFSASLLLLCHEASGTSFDSVQRIGCGRQALRQLHMLKRHGRTSHEVRTRKSVEERRCKLG